MNDIPRMQVVTIRTDELGDRSYVLHDGSSALVIDPQRDIDRITDVVRELGVSVAAVAETHIHNDYLTGGLALAKSADVPYLVSGSDEVGFARKPVRDDDVLRIGALEVRIVATPGHTPGHVAYVVSDPHGATAAFTGGSLLYGAVGRTDLIEDAMTAELTAAQYRSVRRLAESLPDAALVYPTHGFGSFCSGAAPAPRSAEGGSIGHERRVNDALIEPDEGRFVRRAVAGFTPYPAYYAHMAPRNREGVSAPDLGSPPAAEPAEIAERLAVGEWVVDIRHRLAFAADHLAGTVSVELGPQFATYLGWIFPYGEPLTLLAETNEQVAAAQRQLVRIGIDRPAAAAYGDLHSIGGGFARRSFEIATFGDVRDAGVANVIDVRRPDELARDGAIEGSLHVPLADLGTRLADLPDAPLWVHCASGFRAAIAASLLERAGHEVVLVDEPFAAAREAGLTILTYVL